MNRSAQHIPQKREQWLSFFGRLSPETDPATIRLVGLLHRAAHALYQLSETSLSQSNLSYAQYRILLNLLFGEQFEGICELNPSEISERQGISRNTVSALISNLEKEGLIERQLDQEDKRRFKIRLTDSGRDIIYTHASNHFKTIQRAFQSLSAAEQAAMSQMLETLSQNLIEQEKS